MKSPICDLLGIDFPLLASSHCRDVVAAVSRAGGFGVLGATAHSPESVEQELKWIDDHVDGKPYGIDVLIPENISTAGEQNVTWKSLEARISAEHRAFTRDLLRQHDVELTTTSVADNQPQPFDGKLALEVLEASFRHPIRLIANALGVPPKKMIDLGKKHGVPVAALVGAKEHALRQVATDAWDGGPDSPGALPMPLQSIISRDAFNSIDRAAAAGNVKARDLVSYFVGQGVGLIDSVKSAGAVVQEFKEDFADAVEHMNALVAE